MKKQVLSFHKALAPRSPLLNNRGGTQLSKTNKRTVVSSHKNIQEKSHSKAHSSKPKSTKAFLSSPDKDRFRPKSKKHHSGKREEDLSLSKGGKGRKGEKGSRKNIYT